MTPKRCRAIMAALVLVTIATADECDDAFAVVESSWGCSLGNGTASASTADTSSEPSSAPTSGTDDDAPPAWCSDFALMRCNELVAAHGCDARYGDLCARAENPKNLPPEAPLSIPCSDVCGRRRQLAEEGRSDPKRVADFTLFCGNRSRCHAALSTAATACTLERAAEAQERLAQCTTACAEAYKAFDRPADEGGCVGELQANCAVGSGCRVAVAAMPEVCEASQMWMVREKSKAVQLLAASCPCADGDDGCGVPAPLAECQDQLMGFDGLLAVHGVAEDCACGVGVCDGTSSWASALGGISAETLCLHTKLSSFRGPLDDGWVYPSEADGDTLVAELCVASCGAAGHFASTRCYPDATPDDDDGWSGSACEGAYYALAGGCGDMSYTENNLCAPGCADALTHAVSSCDAAAGTSAGVRQYATGLLRSTPTGCTACGMAYHAIFAKGEQGGAGADACEGLESALGESGRRGPSSASASQISRRARDVMLCSQGRSPPPQPNTPAARLSDAPPAPRSLDALSRRYQRLANLVGLKLRIVLSDVAAEPHRVVA